MENDNKCSPENCEFVIEKQDGFYCPCPMEVRNKLKICWTNKKPKVPGFYWLKYSRQKDTERVVEVTYLNNKLVYYITGSKEPNDIHSKILIWSDILYKPIR